MQRASEKILKRIEAEAQSLSRPSIRLASISRLVQACDAIESGAAAELDRRLRGPAPISPSNVERFVKAKCASGFRDWTGPTRVFIAQDADLKAYVAAREDERAKPLDRRKRTSQRQKDIEDALARLPIEIRQIVRHDLEEGRLAKRRLDLLSRGLRTLPGVDVDGLLGGRIEPALIEANSSANIGNAAAPRNSFTKREAELLRNLVDRLTDSNEMSRAGLLVDGRRLRMATLPRTTIIQPDEMALLLRLAELAK